MGATGERLPTRYVDSRIAPEALHPLGQAGVWTGLSLVVKDGKKQYLMLDSTLVRAHQQAATGKGAADQARGLSRGELTNNIHRFADGLERPLRSIVTAGQVGDVLAEMALLDGFDAGRWCQSGRRF